MWVATQRSIRDKTGCFWIDALWPAHYRPVGTVEVYSILECHQYLWFDSRHARMNQKNRKISERQSCAITHATYNSVMLINNYIPFQICQMTSSCHWSLQNQNSRMNREMVRNFFLVSQHSYKFTFYLAYAELLVRSCVNVNLTFICPYSLPQM